MERTADTRRTHGYHPHLFGFSFGSAATQPSGCGRAAHVCQHSGGVRRWMAWITQRARNPPSQARGGLNGAFDAGRPDGNPEFQQWHDAAASEPERLRRSGVGGANSSRSSTGPYASEACSVASSSVASGWAASATEATPALSGALFRQAATWARSASKITQNRMNGLAMPTLGNARFNWSPDFAVTFFAVDRAAPFQR